MNTVLMGWHSAFGAQARKAPAPPQIGPVVLEMIEKDARPSAPGDECLYFRLYQDGTAEFEIKYSDGPLPHGLKVHRIRLKDEELDDLSGLWGGCLDLPGDFDPMRRLEEKVAISRITIRDKDGEYRQKLIHHYSPENEKTRLYLPKPARDLMEQVRHLRAKYFQEA